MDTADSNPGSGGHLIVEAVREVERDIGDLYISL
jgi:hypothetical protein